MSTLYGTILAPDKIQTLGSITLLEGDELVADDKKVAEILNEYFVNITASLEISGVEENLVKTDELRDPVDIAVNMYKRHPSIQLIKQRVSILQYLIERSKFPFLQLNISISLVPKESSGSPCLPIRSYLQETQLSHRQKLRNSSTGKILLKKLFSFIKNLKHIFIPYPLSSSIMRAQVVNMKIVVKPTRNSQEALSTQNQIILKYFQCRAGPNSWFPVKQISVLATK